MYCLRCGGEYPSYESVWISAEGRYVCADCAESHYWECANCADRVPATVASSEDGLCDNCWSVDRYDDDDDDSCDCAACRPRQDEYSSRTNDRAIIHSYGYKPSPVFHGSDAHGLFLGPEIEISTPYRRQDRAASVAQGWLGTTGYLKDDSSISDGFEIVLHPMSYGWAMNHFPWEMLTELRSMGCEATSDCGMHVHVSRAGFSTPCHQYRWQKFVYRNATQVQRIARRVSDQWASFHGAARHDVKHTLKGGYGSTGRYVAINPQNDKTLELRIFASSLQPQEVQAAFGLAAGSIEYTRTLSAQKIIRGKQWEWPAFNNWVSAQAAYAPLASEMSKLCVS